MYRFSSHNDLTMCILFQNDRQILIVTLLVGCTKDQDDTVAAAAVQALSQIILYPSLNNVIHGNDEKPLVTIIIYRFI